MANIIDSAADNIRQAFVRAHDRLSVPLSARDKLRKAGGQHRRRKHGWDFNTMGASYFMRHARRHAHVGETAPAAVLGALAVPTALASVSLLGLIPKVASATLDWPWYYGYKNAQGDESLRKDLVQTELQEATAELQVVATDLDEHPCHRTALQPFLQEARALSQDFTRHMHAFSPKIGGSHRLHKRLRHYERILDSLDASTR